MGVMINFSLFTDAHLAKAVERADEDFERQANAGLLMVAEASHKHRVELQAEIERRAAEVAS